MSSRRTASSALLALCTMATMLWLQGTAQVFAGGFREHVATGNRALESGEIDEARAAYDKASLGRPESPYLYFNRALLAYRTDDLASAREGFEEAALRTKDLDIEALSHYNLGNVAAREAERQVDGDLQKAIETYGQAVKHYQRALELNPELEDAAFNTEVVRIITKDLLDRLENQQEEGGQDDLDDIVKRLAALIEEQQSHISDTSEEAREPRRSEDLADAQHATRESTQDLALDMVELEQSGQSPSREDSALTTARGFVESAVPEQAIAEARLRKQEASAAVSSQQSALELLQKAMEELTEDQEQQAESGEQQQPQDNPESGETEQGDESDEQAEDILREEEENREQRMLDATGRFSPVDRDW